MIVRWTPEALDDRREIWDFIAAENPLAAVELDLRFEASTDSLSDHPEIGRLGLIPGTRELIPHAHYRIVYEIQQNTIWVLAVVHTARLWPPEKNNP